MQANLENMKKPGQPRKQAGNMTEFRFTTMELEEYEAWYKLNQHSYLLTPLAVHTQHAKFVRWLSSIEYQKENIRVQKQIVALAKRMDELYQQVSHVEADFTAGSTLTESYDDFGEDTEKAEPSASA